MSYAEYENRIATVLAASVLLATCVFRSLPRNGSSLHSIILSCPCEAADQASSAQLFVFLSKYVGKYTSFGTFSLADCVLLSFSFVKVQAYLSQSIIRITVTFCFL